MPIDAILLDKLRNNDASLTELRLPKENLFDADILILCKALETNNTLTKLRLRANKMTDIGVQALAQNKTLISLDLGFNKIGIEGVKALSLNKTLRELVIDNNRISNDGVYALAQNQTLTSLDLHYCHVDDIGAQSLARNNTLKTLYLGNNEITDVGARALSVNKVLTTLCLNVNKISDAGAQVLAQNKTLSELDLTGNEIGHAGAQALAQNITLISLVLYSNEIGDAGAQALAQNKSFVELNLSNNKIGDTGAQALAQNKSFVELNLSNNKIGDAGAQALAQNKTLISLDLSENKIGDIGAEALASNSTLANLYLAGHGITNSGAQALIQNKTLTFLFNFYSGKNIDMRVRYQLDDQAQKNCQLADALINACEASDLNKVTQLLAQGVHPYGLHISAKLGRGDTLLHLAVRQRNQPLLNLLLANRTGGILRKYNYDKLTYIQLAQQLGFAIDSENAANPHKTSGSTSWQPHPFSVISPRDLQKGEKIGSGTYGTVYKATWRGIPVALKELRLQVADESIKRNFNNEVQLLANLNHDHIIAYRGIVQEPRSLVMEFAEEGSLFMLLHSSLALTEQERLRFAFEISLAIAYLHQCNPEVIHCDLKSANVLLDKHRKVKLSDFGLSKTKNSSSSQSHNGVCGTPTHMAPELLNPEDTTGSSKLTPKIDIYSFAIILWELATRQIPFADKNALQIMMFVCSGKRLAELVNINPTYKSLVTRCWAQNPSNRPTAKQVVDILKSQMEEVAQTSNTNVTFTSGGFMSMGSWKK